MSSACGLLLLAAACSACSIVESKYYEQLRAADPDAATPSALDANVEAPVLDAQVADRDADAGDITVVDGSAQGGDASTLPLSPFLVDQCPAPGAAAFVLNDTRTFEVDTSKLHNDVDQSAGLKCTGGDVPGNEGFIGMQVETGGVWHIHVTPKADDPSTQNPALYVLDSTCSERDCETGIDACADKDHEHFTFSARGNGVHYLGIDDRNPGGGRYEIQAYKLACGDGLMMHGEGCDASDPASGFDADSCDDKCRVKLDAVNPTESLRSHADFTSANVIQFAALGPALASVAGSIGGCELDYYAFQAPAGSTAHVTMLGADELPCTGEPRVELQLQTDKVETLELGATDATNSCPSLDAELTQGGTYYLRLVDTKPELASFVIKYRLRVQLTPPPIVVQL